MFTLLFGALGAWAGSHVGIAALGTAISGTVPLAIVGAATGLVADAASGK